MLNCLFEVMPLCVVRWVAKRYCERMPMGKDPGVTVVQARNDSLFIVKWGRPDQSNELHENNNG